MSDTNRTVLTSAIITNAKSAIDTYITTATAIKAELDGLIKDLTTNHFTGSASNGYNTFYTTKIVPAISTNLTDPGSSLMESLKTMLDNIQTSLLTTVDEKLGEQNAQAQ